MFLINRLKRNFTGLFIPLNSTNIYGKNMENIEDTDQGDLDTFGAAQLEELALDNFLFRECEAALNFKEKIEEYVYDNFLPFLRYFNMSRLRDMFL